MSTQTQASSMTSSVAPPPASTLGHFMREQQRHSHRPQLQNLPIARDSHGWSPLVHSLQSPRVVSNVDAASPKPASSPSAQLLQSLTPRLTRKPSASARSRAAAWAVEGEEQSVVESSKLSPLPVQDHGSKREDMICHLEKCVRAAPGVQEMRKEVLRACTSREAGIYPVGCDQSIVACEGSPTARVLCRAFPDLVPSKYSNTDAALSALEGRKVHRALLPVESSLQGTVHRTYDLLLRSNVHIVGELVQQKCMHNAAAEQEQEQEQEEEEEEEKEYGRFWVLSKDASVLPNIHKQQAQQQQEEEEEASFKTTVALVLREGLGALHKVLAAFAFRGIPVTKLESRPWRQRPLMMMPADQYPATAPSAAAAAAAPQYRTYFQYVLFVDFQRSTACRAAQNALAQLQEHSSFLRVMGSYPCFHTMALTPRPRIARTTKPQLVAELTPAPLLVGAS